MDEKQIGQIFKDSREELGKRRGMWERYGGKSPIHSRQYLVDGKAVKGKICRRIGNDFIGEIVDDKVGFLVGNPVSYGGEGIDLFLTRWKDWIRREGLDDWNSDWVLEGSLAGVGYRVLYREARDPLSVKVKQLPPHEVIDWEDEEGRHALRFWMDDKKQTHATYYGPRQVIEYIAKRAEYSTDGNREDVTIPVFVPADHAAPIDHLFPGCPVIPLENNSRRLGDCAKVLELIDQIDRILSDASSEVEQFRLAYVALMGDRSPAGDDNRRTFLEKMRESGIMFLPNGSDAKFITKALDFGGLKILLDILIDHIYRFAKAVNPSKADTNTTTVALRQRMHAVRNKCSVMERKMAWSLREQARLVSGYWQLAYGEPAIDQAALEVIFTPNFPINLIEEAQFLSVTKDILSDETRFGSVSLVEDPAAEIERMNAEKDTVETITPPVGAASWEAEPDVRR